MKFLSRFMIFAKKVISAAKKGGLREPELRKLTHLLKKTGKRNRVLAQGILTALNAGGSSKKDIMHFSELLESANQRILDEKVPFTKKQQKELNGIFARAYVSKKTRRWFSTQLDELMAGEINDVISGEKKLMGKVPERKTVKFMVRKETRKAGKKLKL